MTLKKVGLLTMLISLFVFNACKKNTTIGLNIDDDLALNSQVVIDSTLITQLLEEDSIPTNNQTNNPLGFFKDPIFGETQADIAAALTLPNGSTAKFDASAVLDSAVLVLPYAGFYGDSLNTNYKVEVRELNEPLYESNSSTFYFNTKQWAHKTNLLGSSDVFSVSALKKEFAIVDIIIGKKDTVKKVIPQLRIKLNTETITKLFLKADSATLSSNINFTNYFKGLYISLNKEATITNGGVFLFNTLTSGAARLDIFYKETKANKIDTLQKSFALAGNQGNVASHIKWDYTGTVLATEIGKTNSEKLYLKGLAGTKIKVSFPNIKNIKNLGKQITINKAQLIIKVVDGSQTPYAPLPLLKVYRWDIANRPQLLPDESQNDPRNIGEGYIGGVYNTTSKNYIFNVTAYIQDLLSGKTDYGTFISTISYTDAKSNSSNFGRAIIGGSLGNYKIQLKVYYTDLK